MAQGSTGASDATRRRISPAEVAASIRDRVVRGEWAPGQRLTEEDLAEQYAVSRIPIREALRLLETDGFVTVKPYSGTFVTMVGPEEAVDLLDIRAALEPLGAGRAAKRRTDAHIARLREIVDEAEVAIAASDTTPLSRLTADFHRVVAEASTNPSLATMIGLLQSKIEWVFAIEEPERIAESWIEHRLLVNAIERRDAETATELMRAHVSGAHAAYRHRYVENTE